jgi:Zn-dependent protease with chaperone function
MKTILLFLLVCLAFACLPPAHAQTNSSGDSAQVARKVTEYTLPPDKLAKSANLRTTRIRVWIVSSIYGLALLLLFLYARWSARFRDLAEKASHRQFVQAVIFVPLFLVTLNVLNLPPDIYSHHLSRVYGLSVQGWPSWFGDWAKALAIQLIAGVIIFWLLYLIIRHSPRRCWFYFWLISLPIIVFVVFIAPVILDPMFNKFEPLQKTNPVLVTQIEEVLQRAGVSIPPDRIFEMKASAKSTELNAYVTGFGATKRVVVWDTTEQKMTTPQVLFVVGHETGHYVLNHIWKGMIFFAGFSFVLFYLGYRASIRLLARFGPRWAIRDLGDWASLPALLMVISVLGFFAQPAASAFSRTLEHHADIYGLEVIHGIVPDSQQVAAQAFQVLGENSLSYPDPSRVLVWWLADHPPICDRVPFAANYNPWDKGQQPEFVR